MAEKESERETEPEHLIADRLIFAAVDAGVCQRSGRGYFVKSEKYLNAQSPQRSFT